MVKTRKLMSAVLAGVMLLSMASCSLLGQDKKTKEADPDDIIELAESRMLHNEENVHIVQRLTLLDQQAVTVLQLWLFIFCFTPHQA